MEKTEILNNLNYEINSTYDNNNINAFIVLICGIPGCGKSSLANQIKQAIYISNDQLIKTEILNFDELLIKENIKLDQTNNEYQFDYINYRNTRAKFVENFKILVKNTINNQIKQYIFIIDDNFNLYSLKKKFYKASKELLEEISVNYSNIKFFYVEVIINCDIEVAIANNNKRQGYLKVDDKSIKKMFDNLQFKTFQNFRNIIIKNSNIKNLEEFITYIIETSKSNQIIDIKQIEDKKDINNKTKKSLFLEQLEISLRKCISAIIKKDKNLRLNFSVIKKHFMNLIKAILTSKYINLEHNFDNNKKLTENIYFEVEIILDILQSQNYKTTDSEDYNKLLNYFEVNYIYFNNV